MATCHICPPESSKLLMPDGTVAPTLADDTRLIIEHSRVMHPDLYEKTEKWPDGEVVIHFEDVLEPSDFTS